MTQLFVSYSSRDRTIAEWVCERLRAAGFGALFVAFDPDEGIPTGRGWEHELYVQLRKCDGVIFLASMASISSQWCFAEVCLARSLGRPVFPLRLEPGVRLPLLDEVQWMDLPSAGPGLARLRAGLQAAGLEPAYSFGWDQDRSPYPGLAPFGPEDAAVFFGREQETDRLVELLQPTLQHGPGRFVAIVGPSGSGKSSLLRAGLLPRLARSSDRWVVLPPLIPGLHPVQNLARCLSGAFNASGQTRSVDELGHLLCRGPSGLAQLAEELAELHHRGGSLPSVLVVVDQAEELLVRSGVPEQQAFLHLLKGALGEDCPLWAVATMRSEYLTAAPDRAGLAEAIDDPLIVEPLSRARLGEVILRPAQPAGLEFDPGLVEQMVEDTSGGDALPLLAYTLRELCQRAGPDGRISRQDYAELGGVIGALRGRADRLAEELSRRGHGEHVISTLTRLANVTGEGEPTRRRVRRSALSAGEQMVVDAFVDASLLISGQNPADPTAEPIVEVAHEALLRQWRPLREAIETGRTALRLRSELEQLAAEWQQGGLDKSYLLRGGRLAMFDAWASRNDSELGPLERAFIEASRALAARKLKAIRRSNTRLRLLAAGLAVLLIVALAAGGLAWQQNRQAQAQARLAWSRQLAVQADRLVSTRPDMSILVGLQSLSLAQGQESTPPAGLVSGLARVTHASWVVGGHTDPVRDVAFSPDSRLLATASLDRTVRFWDAATGQPHGTPLTGHTGGVWGVAFSPDGRLLATASADQTVRLWDPATGRPHGSPLTGHTGGVWVVAFSPDGRLLATAGADKTVRLWDPATGKPHGPPLTGHTDAVYGLAFSPDGRLLASASGDQTVRLWDPATGQSHGPPLTGHTDAVNDVAFSPDGRLLATASTDRTVRLWDPATGQSHGPPLTGHTDGVSGIAFSPDGRLLATASADKTVRLWDPATGRQHGTPLTGHTGGVSDLTFSPDGRLLATASADQTARIWEVPERYSISQPLDGHADRVWGVAFSPDGRLLATASADQTVRLWDPATGQPHGNPLTGHTGGVWVVAFSPDGRLLATAGADKTVRLWDPVTGQPHGPPLTGHTNAVYGLAFSPDGRLLASASGDQTVRLWDPATGRSHGPPLTGHTNEVNDVAFSPNGELLATASTDGTVRLWDPATGRPHGAPLTGDNSRVWGVAFSPDGRLLATAGADQTVRLWDPTTGQPSGPPLTGHTDGVTAVAFSPDGQLLASVSGDQTVRLWDPTTGQPHGPPLTGHTDWINAVAFSPDGRHLATGSSDQTARLWNPAFDSWLTSGCTLVNRNLTMAEWNQVAQGLPYQRTCPGLPPGQGAPPDAPAASYPRQVN